MTKRYLLTTTFAVGFCLAALVLVGFFFGQPST